MRTSIIFLIFIVATLVQIGQPQIVCGIFRFVSPLFSGLFKQVQYLYFSRNNPKEPCDLQAEESALKKCNFNPKRSTKIIIHGWIPHIAKDGNDYQLKDHLLRVDDYNVILVNWTAYFVPYDLTIDYILNYRLAIYVANAVGTKVSAWIKFLVDAGVDPKNIHMYGHSLGAALVSVSAKTTCTIGKITYLDAAAPTERYIPSPVDPSYTDADFVEEIHSSAALTLVKGFGYVKPIAQLDFYPNGGNDQPNCYQGAHFSHEIGADQKVTNKSNLITCNHEASYNFYLASFNQSCKFLGRICDSWDKYKNGDCSNAPVCRMGFYSKKPPGSPVHLKCYLKTSKKYPYCLN